MKGEHLCQRGHRGVALQGVGNSGDALCGVGSIASVVKPTQLVLRKIKLQSRRIRTQEKRW